MWTKNTKMQFKRCMIAKSMDGSFYDCQGYVAVVDGDFAGIAYYGHESMYDTFDSLICNEQGAIDWDWVGTPQELVQAALNESDIMFPDRKINPQDHDYKLLSQLYREIKKWANKQQGKNKKKYLKTSGIA
jgi:hypothetical protein